MPTTRHGIVLALALLTMPGLGHAAAAPAAPGLPPPFAELGIDLATADPATIATAVARLGYPPLIRTTQLGDALVIYHTVDPATGVSLTFLYDWTVAHLGSAKGAHDLPEPSAAWERNEPPYLTIYRFRPQDLTTLETISGELATALGPPLRRNADQSLFWELTPDRWISLLPTSYGIHVTYAQLELPY